MSDAPVLPRVAPVAPLAEPRRSLRIALLSYRSDPRVGGQGIYASRLARALAARGHTVDILSGPPYPEVPAGVGLVKIPSLDLYAQPHHGHRALRWRHLLSWADTSEYFGHLAGVFMEPYTFGRRAAALVARHPGRWDVAIDNQSLAQGLLAIDRAGLPVVGVIHHPIRRDLELALAAQSDPGRRWLIRQWYAFLKMQEKVAPRLRRVIVVSEASATDVAECLSVDPARTTVIPCGVDPEVFAHAPFERRAVSRILTTASADVPLKGLRYLIEAYADLLRERPDLELRVVGRLREGPTQELIARLGLERSITFRHDLDGPAMAAEFATATVCVSPSLYEGFGLPAAEAMATGAAVVVTDGGALPEVVGEAGLVVPKADPAALAAAIGALLDDPQQRRALGQAAAARVRARFAWDRVAQAWEGALLETLEAAC